MTGIPTAMAAACGVLSARFDKYGRDSIMIEFPIQAMSLEKMTIKKPPAGCE